MKMAPVPNKRENGEGSLSDPEQGMCGAVGSNLENKGQVQLLKDFFGRVVHDPRIGMSHIALYGALYQRWEESGCVDPLQVYSREVMPFAKIFGSATYHRVLRELHAYGYLCYEPSFNRLRRSRIYLGLWAAEMRR